MPDPDWTALKRQFHELLVRWMHQEDLSPTKAAARLGISYPMFQHYLQEKHLPWAMTLDRFRQAGVPIPPGWINLMSLRARQAGQKGGATARVLFTGKARTR